MLMSIDSTSVNDRRNVVERDCRVFHLGLAVVNLITAFLYWWAWKDRSSFDVVLIPEYLNHIQAVLYLWSAVWYQRQETLGGHYTMAVHKIEVSASASELLAAIGWSVLVLFSTLQKPVLFIVQDDLLAPDIHTNFGSWLHSRRS